MRLRRVIGLRKSVQVMGQFSRQRVEIETEWDLACDDLIDYAKPMDGMTHCQENPSKKHMEIDLENIGKCIKITSKEQDYHVPHTAPWLIYTICAAWTHACEIYHLRSLHALCHRMCDVDGPILSMLQCFHTNLFRK